MAAHSIPAEAFDDDAEPRSTLRLLKPRAKVLSVSANQSDHLVLYRLMDASQWTLVTADTCRDAVRQLWLNGARVVFCDHSLPDGNWRNVVGRISRIGAPPRFVVMSTLADASLRSEVLNLGGCAVLVKPLMARDVQRVLESAYAPDPRPLGRGRAFRSGH